MDEDELDDVAEHWYRRYSPDHIFSCWFAVRSVRHFHHYHIRSLLMSINILIPNRYSEIFLHPETLLYTLVLH